MGRPGEGTETEKKNSDGTCPGKPQLTAWLQIGSCPGESRLLHRVPVSMTKGCQSLVYLKAAHQRAADPGPTPCLATDCLMSVGRGGLSCLGTLTPDGFRASGFPSRAYSKGLGWALLSVVTAVPATLPETWMTDTTLPALESSMSVSFSTSPYQLLFL